jgi:RNAse (barnase) inhibitor barstar
LPSSDLKESLPWLRGLRVHAVDARREEEVRAALVAAGFDLRILGGSRIQSDVAFFHEAAHALGFPEYFGRNWDAFNDCLGDVVFGTVERIAILWRDADHSLAADVQTVLNAVLAFEAAGSAAIEEREPAQLEVFLFGGAPGFQS